MNTRHLPPLQSVRAFAAAARHESLRIAASELGVTPSAISHQIKVIEEWVGAALFVRVGRDVQLSSMGRALAPDVGKAFELLAAAFADARSAASESVLRVSMLPLFAQAWLIPRLPRFEKAHPGITLSLDTSSRLLDFDRDPVDIAIRNSTKPSAKLYSRKLLDLRAVPLCSPVLAQRISCVDDLTHVTLIHLSTGSQGWPDWLAAAGVARLKSKAVLTVDTMTAALEAAASGQGAMLGLSPLVWDMPAAATLIVPFDTDPIPAGAYYLVHRKSDRARRPIQAFVTWITQEMQRDASRLRQRTRLRRHPGVRK